jgi:hypothetical protein
MCLALSVPCVAGDQGIILDDQSIAQRPEVQAVLRRLSVPDFSIGSPLISISTETWWWSACTPAGHTRKNRLMRRRAPLLRRF